MISRLWRSWRAWTRADALSARWLLLWALRISLVFALVHLAGLREHTTVLSGSVVASGFLGVVYLLTYFAAILLVPPLLIAAAVAKVAERVLGSR